jgi:hypothetical protein
MNENHSTNVDAHGELSNDKVDTTIKPDTYGNKINLCSFSFILNCFNYNKDKEEKD